MDLKVRFRQIFFNAFIINRKKRVFNDLYLGHVHHKDCIWLSCNNLPLTFFFFITNKYFYEYGTLIN